jgi:hypothetical protein
MAMEDLWKLREMSYRLNDVADRAEYDRMLKRFRDEEESANRNNLLYGQSPFARPIGDRTK